MKKRSMIDESICIVEYFASKYLRYAVPEPRMSELVSNDID